MLPKQQITMYELVVPSTGAKLKYRPFTVREQKLLMIAQQSDELKIMVDTLKEIIRACTNEKVNLDSLAVFDLEYIMATLRTKSAGETVKLEFSCDADSTHPVTIVDLDLSKIEVTKYPGHDKKIGLYDDVGVVMKYPDIGMLESLHGIEETPEMVFGIIYDCIDYIYDSDEVFHAKDQTQAELVEFIDGLTKEQFSKIENFYATMPKFTHTLQYKCATCGHEHNKVIEGFSNFF